MPFMIRGIFALVALAIIIGGAYFAYDYVKKNPPDFLIGLVTATKPPPPLPAGVAAPITVPEGFSATIFSRDVPGARVMLRDPKGTMLVSLTSEGKVVALTDYENTGQAATPHIVLEGLRQPHGLAVICPDTGSTSADQDACVLYVAETDALKSYAYDADTLTARFTNTVATFPSGDGHYTRTLLPHPDGRRLLVSIGSSCNVCEETDARRATVQAIDLATDSMTTFATGLRNTVFMTVHPVTGEIWGTDNGRDLIGDDIPPDDVNIIRQGGDYGWPICYGANVHDTDFDKRQYIQDPCTGKIPPRIALQAHSAALGLAFVPEEGWPEAYWHDLIVAYHGSWNRSEPTGYKVVRFDFDARGNLSDPIAEDFVTGFLALGADEDDAIGRPAGVLIEPGGVMYISDDRAGAIYRIARTNFN